MTESPVAWARPCVPAGRGRCASMSPWYGNSNCRVATGSPTKTECDRGWVSTLLPSVNPDATNELVPFGTPVKRVHAALGGETWRNQKGEGLIMQGPFHHPRVTQRADHMWIVRCPQCEGSQSEAVPLGIAMPLQSRQVTELIFANHQKRTGAPPVRRIV